MDVTIIGMDDKAICAAEAVELRHTEEQHTLFAKLPLSVQLAAGNGIGFKCVDGRYRIFEITKREIVEPDGVWEVTAIDKAVRELMDEPIEEQRARNISISVYAGRLIQNTRFTLGSVQSSTYGTATAYYESVWSALEGAADAYNVNIIPYYAFTNGLVTGRYIDITNTLGADRGRLFEFGDDMTGVRVTYDDSNVKTALYGRGRGVEIESEEGDAVSYGRRLTFADVVWSTSSGDPVNKPLNQEWVADPAAQAAFGRDGRNRFGFAVFEDCTDAEQLLQLTWDQLQKQKDPAISISASIVDTERLMGHSHEAVRLGDPVLVRIPAKKLDIRANISAIVRDYIHPEETQLTISNAAAVATGTSAGKIMANIQQTVGGMDAKSDVWNRANAFDINGVMNVMHNQIISTTGNWYTDPDTGAIMMVSADGTKAMMLNGSGWMIANGKTGDTWNWRTAATGSGIVADEITTGNLNASLITTGQLNADLITTGTLTANVISTGSVPLGKLKPGAVFTSINDTGITVRHTSAGNAYTTLDASGLRIFNSSNVNIGGIYVPTGQSEVKAGFTSLFNPSYPNFSIQLIRAYDGESQMYYYGFGLYRQSTLVCGIGVEDSASPGSGFLFYTGAAGTVTGVALSTIISVCRAFAGYDPSDFEPAS